MARDVIVIDDDDDDHRASSLAPSPQKHGLRDVVVLIEDDHRASLLAPTSQHGVFLEQRGFAASPPPRLRPSVGGILLGRREDCGHRDERGGIAASSPPKHSVGGPCLPAALGAQPDEVRVPSDGHRLLPLVTRHPQQSSGVDNHDKRRGVAYAGGILHCRASFPTTPRPHTDAVGVPSDGPCFHFVTPNPQRAVAKAPEVVVLSDDDDDHHHRLTPSAEPEQHGVVVDQHAESRTIAASPPPSLQQSVSGIGRLSLPTFDGCRPFFLTPPPAAKADSFGVRESRRALFFTPPARSGRIFRDPFEVRGDEDEDEDGDEDDVSTVPPAKKRSLFLDQVKITNAEGDSDCTPTKLTSCNKTSRSAGQACGRSSSCVRGGRRGLDAGPAGGRRVQVGLTRRESRARALAELLGNGDPKLKPDSGPAPGQDFNEWQEFRNLDLKGEYEYLDGLLTRIYRVSHGRRITALAREGWAEFYTRLEVCIVVRRQMREAKANPAPVPERLMAEVR